MALARTSKNNDEQSAVMRPVSIAMKLKHIETRRKEDLLSCARRMGITLPDEAKKASSG